MAKRRTIEDELRDLEATRDDPRAADSLAALRQALCHRSSHVVAKAAAIAGEGRVDELAVELCAAFDRFMAEPGADRGCAAKSAVADALFQIDHRADEQFLRGIRHVQMEASFGKSIDTAAALRGVCAMGLARAGLPEALVEVSQLLADPEPPARLAAARALACTGRDGAIPLLRFKALIGDDEPEVLSECLAGLLQIDSGDVMPFVTAFLDHRNANVQEAAALALGSSRRADAFEPLADWSRRIVDDGLRRTAFTAIALLRVEEGFAFLLELVADGSLATARDAVAAIGIYGDDSDLRDSVAARIRARDDADQF